MYREIDQSSSVGGHLGGDDGWQDWPPETSSVRFEGEPAVVTARLLQTPGAGDSHPVVSYYRDPGTLAPAPLGSSGTDSPDNSKKPRGRTAKRVALVLGVLLALGVAGWYGQYW
jgi:hypothetical protein